jgi:branched-chain amino acid transport system ATP-binding protein
MHEGLDLGIAMHGSKSAAPASVARILLHTDGLSKNYGGLVVTDQVSLKVAEGEVHAIIGPNGAGKTTLIGQLSGEINPNAGRIFFDGTEITQLPTHQRATRGLARTFQITSIFPEFTVLDNVALSVQAHAGHSFRFFSAAQLDRSLRDPAFEMLRQIGLADKADIVTANLSHGERRALELAMALSTKPKLLLLDEPMAGMGLEDSSKMVSYLATIKGKITIVLVEHDMDAVFALADRITVLVHGRAIATGTPDEIRNNPAVRQAYLGDEGEG